MGTVCRDENEGRRDCRQSDLKTSGGKVEDALGVVQSRVVPTRTEVN